MLDNRPNIIEDLKELVQATSIKLKLSQFAVEKDFYITKAIQALTQVSDDYFALIFQGGTSLSKGYQIIRRLSEDADFRIVYKQETLRLGKDARRKKLRDFRYTLVDALQNAGFKIPVESIQVFYEGQFMRIQAEFMVSAKITYLKPHIAIECFLGELILDPQSTEITTLIQLTLNEPCQHPTFAVNCVALDETAAEKWVALTRRIAGTQLKERASDKHLVRHLYDLYHLKKSGLLTGDYYKIVHDIMKKDKNQFKKHNSTYAEDPIRTSERALDLLFEDPLWQDHWNIFLEQMVYEENKPTFLQAFEVLRQFGHKIFSYIKENQEK